MFNPSAHTLPDPSSLGACGASIFAFCPSLQKKFWRRPCVTARRGKWRAIFPATGTNQPTNRPTDRDSESHKQFRDRFVTSSMDVDGYTLFWGPIVLYSSVSSSSSSSILAPARSFPPRSLRPLRASLAANCTDRATACFVGYIKLDSLAHVTESCVRLILNSLIARTCVCMCVWERERERDSFTTRTFTTVFMR